MYPELYTFPFATQVVYPTCVYQWLFKFPLCQTSSTYTLHLCTYSSTSFLFAIQVVYPTCVYPELYKFPLCHLGNMLIMIMMMMIIIMYIYHALINAPSSHIIYINLNMIFCTHVEHSPTKTIHIKYYTDKQTYALHPPPSTYTHTMTVAETGY